MSIRWKVRVHEDKDEQINVESATKAIERKRTRNTTYPARPVNSPVAAPAPEIAMPANSCPKFCPLPINAHPRQMQKEPKRAM